MNREQFTREISVRCGQHPEFFNQIQAGGGPMIGIVGFDNYPSAGRFTYFSHGLHLLNKREWVAGRPEYFITIDNPNREFALFFAYLLSAFAGEKVMGWNTLLGAGDVDAVDGYPYRRIALGPPTYLGWLSYELPDATELPINFGMAYFLSDDDFERAAEMGIGYLQLKLEQDPDYWWKIRRRDSTATTGLMSDAAHASRPTLWSRLRGLVGRANTSPPAKEGPAEIWKARYAQHGLLVVCSKLCIGQDRRPVRHAVREESKNAADSGWMLSSGEESDVFASDAKNFVLTPLDRLLAMDPTLRILLD